MCKQQSLVFVCVCVCECIRPLLETINCGLQAINKLLDLFKMTEHIQIGFAYTGKLTVIVGRNGSGKTSLLAAILKEMCLMSGELIWNK